MKTLREGFTTGSCAAAAALAGCLWRRDGVCPEWVEWTVPEGRLFRARVCPHADFACGVVKGESDDPDVTRGLEVIARVEILDAGGEITFVAGEGVGTITEPGLKIPPGGAAINPVPREMIRRAIGSVYPGRGARVTVSIPGGREIAKKTFNPRLGIQNGLSVLGTSGIVRPMSLEALRASMRAELEMRVNQGRREMIFTFGNQGEAALSALYPGETIVQVSNELGYMLDEALELGVRKLLIGGHPGKLVKVSAGVMQTHSRYADARREAIIAQLALMGAPMELMTAISETVTTEAAIDAIARYHMEAVWDRLAAAARRYCRARVRDQMEMNIVFVDSLGRKLGECME